MPKIIKQPIGCDRTMMMLTNDKDVMVFKMIAFDHDDHHQSDQTQVPMWPGGDFLC